MDLKFARQQVIDLMRRDNLSPEGAAGKLARGFGLPPQQFEPAVKSIRRDGQRNMLLDSPPGVIDTGLVDEARSRGWYAGETPHDVFWPRLKAKMLAGGMREAVDDVDRASKKVVANLADPSLPNLSKRGLVLGYVQSGKTANFTAVMAKAADAGYSLFIVLSGLHNNLREQTQVRLDGDLIDNDWHQLTNATDDFAYHTPGAAVVANRVKAIAVVKKNQSRLRALRDWLRDIPEETRRRVPILLLDDEADQATPNSAAGQETRSRINQLVRQIWSEIPTGTYVGYTATPFANVFMDPNDDEELYPADFIIDLPRPSAYFGAERIFGREPLDDDEDPDPGLDVIREVTEDEAQDLKPPGKRDERLDFDPELPESLVESIRWFVVASAIRRARGQRQAHSSMLVHTTHFVDPHFTMRDRVEDLLDDFRKEWMAEAGHFLHLFEREAHRASEVASLPMPPWSAVAAEIEPVLDATRVVVDNGASEDRLDYNRIDEDGRPVPESVIAIGGGTLSRGLTLEGLVVSYFTRTSNTYDTLLQMGRWFGFRPGYEDLPRMWLQKSLEDEFRFLAMVEEEIRQDIRDMERSQLTPRQLGIRVRAHPGRLAIVARNKMQHANLVQVSYSGQRLQTFLLHEKDAEVLSANLAAARVFLQRAQQYSSLERLGARARWLIRDVPSREVVTLFEEYRFHPDHAGLKSESLVGWIESAVPDGLWNVVIAGKTVVGQTEEAKSMPLGSVDLGSGLLVPAVNRSPLNTSPIGTANIKSLLSHNDWFADLDPDTVGSLSKEDKKHPREIRRNHADDRGLIIVMPVSRHSVPSEAAAKAESRRDMAAPEHLVGLGIIFPEASKGSSGEGDYYGVTPDWEPEVAEDEDIPFEEVEQ